MTLTGLLQLIVKRTPNGFGRTLEVLNFRRKNNMQDEYLHNLLSPAVGDKVLNIERFDEVVTALGAEIDVAEFFAHKAGAYVVQLQSKNVALDDMSLLDAFITSTDKRNAFLKIFQKAYSKGRISPKEMQKIKKASDDFMQVHLAIREYIEQIAERG